MLLKIEQAENLFMRASLYRHNINASTVPERELLSVYCVVPVLDTADFKVWCARMDIEIEADEKPVQEVPIPITDDQIYEANEKGFAKLARNGATVKAV